MGGSFPGRPHGVLLSYETKTKNTRRKEIIKIRAKINQTENRKRIEKNKIRFGLLKRTTKLINL